MNQEILCDAKVSWNKQRLNVNCGICQLDTLIGGFTGAMVGSDRKKLEIAVQFVIADAKKKTVLKFLKEAETTVYIKWLIFSKDILR